MTDLKTTLRTPWSHLKNWSLATGLPVLPPPAALIELVVLFATMGLIDLAFPSVGFLNLEPSPFWLPILLLSLQYGTVAGVLAAAAATGVYVFNGVGEQAVGENFFSYLLRIWALPILWIGVALVLGQFRLRQIAVKHDARLKLQQRDDEATRLAGYARELEDRCHRLERQLTTGTAISAKPVLDALAEFAAGSREVGTALDTLTKTIWPGTQASLLTADPHCCVVIAKSGWPETASWATEIPASHPLYRAVIGERRALSILNMGDENSLAGHGVAAHPVLSSSSDRVIGMLKIEAMDPDYLERATINHLRLLSRLFALRIAEAQNSDAGTGLPPAKISARRLPARSPAVAPATEASAPASPTQVSTVAAEGARRKIHPLRSS